MQISWYTNRKLSTQKIVQRTRRMIIELNLERNNLGNNLKEVKAKDFVQLKLVYGILQENRALSTKLYQYQHDFLITENFISSLHACMNLKNFNWGVLVKLSHFCCGHCHENCPNSCNFY